ncbi:hypothetical protein EV13_2167 [Prochlorococcus sp. MIT 0702]|nr:hypothetical protein EV12_2183 [Prochlorococcus sp. MIT 0701]KGG27311.1 hypothetical protein EV13_2167 [Prochlorococcus sp. MIT 0702]KGG31523.1 hypothetical protein EV14_2201 [Prochlorococcus sp. MIT 0703]
MEDLAVSSRKYPTQIISSHQYKYITSPISLQTGVTLQAK